MNKTLKHEGIQTSLDQEQQHTIAAKINELIKITGHGAISANGTFVSVLYDGE